MVPLSVCEARETDGQADRQTDRQTEKQTNKQRRRNQQTQYQMVGQGDIQQAASESGDRMQDRT